MLPYIIDALAVHRLTKLAVEDVVFDRIRNKIFDKYPPNPDSWSYALTCPWCFSIYAGAGVVAARALTPNAWRYTAAVLAFSSVTGLIEEHF